MIDAPEHRTSLTLPADELAPSRARSFTRAALIAWGVEDLLDETVLIVSELTTNAEQHGRRPAEPDDWPSAADRNVDEITLTLAFQADIVGIEVEDNSPEPPSRGSPPPSRLADAACSSYPPWLTPGPPVPSGTVAASG
ncbi:ATP-binding protein [Streptomyces vilmorinianum]|uniref:ATP-binding protein n=1 Tax=Streptomyces vilmorinianum TaxID=3051092 RepID=UPI0010FAE4F8|nr:ATP-binding protein [Streptomyces vilmorinianum]